jgi:hypothetical protein
MGVNKMKLYVIRCYNRETEKTPCLVQAYKQKRAAMKRAEKARETFCKVEIQIVYQ